MAPRIKRSSKNEKIIKHITLVKQEEPETLDGIPENGPMAVNVPIRFTFTELKGLAIPATIPERKAFEIQIKPGSCLKEVMESMKDFYSKASPKSHLEKSIKETHSNLVNIKNKIYKFTISQLLQLLVAYKGLFIIKNHARRSYITFKSKTPKRCLHFFKLLLRYDQEENLIYVRNSDIPSCTIATTYSMVPFGGSYELSTTSIPVTIPEDENVTLDLDSDGSFEDVAKELDTFCKERMVPQPGDKVHRSFRDTFKKLSKMNDEGEI
ncbi:unnamed protein product [Ambrosiozyma monospora]|uniref:Unnamed protein product n=1 Tax=Ambrosiozyma monospora TaxID=43982 RepID=A0ACB5TD83_AMBMO|nr:unnamed protein product [Ambrosiozyma monospora]